MLKFREKLSYSWIVVFVFLIVNIILEGTRLSFGVFFKSIESYFDLTRAATSAVISAYMLFGAVFSILIGWALDRYGTKVVVLLMGIFTGLGLFLTSQTNAPWQLFITYSFLYAVGTGAVYVATMSSISKLFTIRRGLALGITGTGAGLGQMLFAPFAAYLISVFDWRIAYIILGAIAWLVIIPLTSLLRKATSETGAFPEATGPEATNTNYAGAVREEYDVQTKALSLRVVLKTTNFWLLIFTWLFHGFTTMLVITHLVPHATDVGIVAVEASTVLSLYGGALMIGGVLMGHFSDKIGGKASIIICALLRAVAMVWLIFSQDLWMFYLFALVYGFATSGIAICLAALASDVFGLRRIGVIMGVLSIGFAVGSAIGPAIGGLIFDVTSSYFIAFLLGAVAALMVAVLTLAVRR